MDDSQVNTFYFVFKIIMIIVVVSVSFVDMLWC